MAAEPPPEEQEEGAPAWMLTYGDMVTLVLTFFVLLVSMMVVDPKKFVEVLGTSQKKTAEGANLKTPDEPQKTENYFMQIIRVASRRSETLEGGNDMTKEGEAVRVFSFEENYITTMTERPFFQPFEVRLTDSAKRRLAILAKKINEDAKGHSVKLIGHYAPDEGSFGSLQSAVTFEGVEDDFFDPGDGEPETKREKVLVRKFEIRKAGVGMEAAGDGSQPYRWVFISTPRDLAYYRAESVRDFLLSKGVPAKNMASLTAGAIRPSRVFSKAGATAQDFKKIDGAMEYKGESKVDILENSAEASTVAKERAVVDGQMLRPWPQFIFVDSGSDRGRLVEIVISGNLSH